MAHAGTAARKETALRAVTRAATQNNKIERTKLNTMLLARESGASLREIAAAAGMPHTTVKDMLDRYDRKH